jgi:hypothetical protein
VLDTTALTPLQQVGNFLVKRDDLFEIAGVRGGKARTCWAMGQGASGLVTASSRSSPQANIAAHVAKALGVPCRRRAVSCPPPKTPSTNGNTGSD